MSNINVQMHDENNNNLFPYTYAENVFDQNGHRLEDLLNNLMTGDIVSAAYSASKTYAVGDYCIYSNTLYRCTTAITTAEAWNSNHWTATDAGTELALKMNKANPVGTGSFSLNRKANTTVGSYSTAEGYNCTASASNAHAEGSSTVASGSTSHAEGYWTTASGQSSHAEGSNTTANHKSQHVFGEYNVADPSISSSVERGDYIEIVGNGTSSARSNARTLDWLGNEVLAGKLTATDMELPSGSTWDGTNASLATAITSLNSTLVKYKTHTFESLSNSSSSAYYITLSNNIFTLLNVSEICSMYINGWGNLGKTPLTLVVENSSLYLLFNEGQTFSNGVLTVKFGYR